MRDEIDRDLGDFVGRSISKLFWNANWEIRPGTGGEPSSQGLFGINEKRGVCSLSTKGPALLVSEDPVTSYSPGENGVSIIKVDVKSVPGMPNMVPFHSGIEMSRVLTEINWPEDFANNSKIAFPQAASLDSGIANPPHPQIPETAVEQWDVVDVGMGPPAVGFAWNSNDLSLPDTEATDEIGHATHVAGIACGRPVGQFSGVAPKTSIIAIRTIAPAINATTGSRTAFGTSSNIAAAVREAIERRAAVINMSFGYLRNSEIEALAISRAISTGIAVVAAIGNDGLGGAKLRPSAYPGVIAVGAIDSTGQRWTNSQGGPHLWVMAPGVEIESCALDGGFRPDTGTSMACAVVSGVIALMKAKRPSLSVAEIRSILSQTCRRPAGAGQTEGFGWGVIDARAAVDAA